MEDTAGSGLHGSEVRQVELDELERATGLGRGGWGLEVEEEVTGCAGADVLHCLFCAPLASTGEEDARPGGIVCACGLVSAPAVPSSYEHNLRLKGALEETHLSRLVVHVGGHPSRTVAQEPVYQRKADVQREDGAECQPVPPARGTLALHRHEDS